MMDVVFIRKYPSCKSAGSATVSVFAKSDFVNKKVGKIDRNDVQFCKLGEYSEPMCSMTLKKFENSFNYDDLYKMLDNGLLDYNSKERSLSRKYPMFSAEVYKKYGKDVSKDEQN